MAKKDTAAAAATPVEETPVEKPVKAPVNPQVPAQYKNETSGKYLPGRDARHASDVAKRIVAGEDEQEALAELGSDALREKAIKQVGNAHAAFAKQGTVGTVVIDDVEYEARKVRGSGIVRVDGESGWVEYPSDSNVAGTFESTADREASKAEAEKANMADAE